VIQRENNFELYENKGRSHHHSLLWKTMKKSGKEMVYKTGFGSGSRLCVGKVSASYSVNPKTISLIKWAKKSVVY